MPISDTVRNRGSGIHQAGGRRMRAAMVRAWLPTATWPDASMWSIHARSATRSDGTSSGRMPQIEATRRIYTMNTGYWYGKFLIGVIAGLTTFVTMKLLGLPYAAALSLFVGITDLIPNIGATLGTIPVVVVGLLEEPWKGVVAGAVLILYQQVENNLITPKVFKETVEIHPFLSVVTVIVFTSLFGIVGALIAVPVTKAIEILIGAWRVGHAPTLEPPLPEPGGEAVP